MLGLCLLTPWHMQLLAQLLCNRSKDAEELKNRGRFAKGVIAMKLHEGDKVTAICREVQ